MEAQRLDHQWNNNNNSSVQSPQKVALPKIRKQIFKPTQGNDFRGENTPDWAKKLYLEPLLEGWRREIVTRSTPSRSSGDVPDADVYYWPPQGKKLRSRPEIAEFLEINGITKFSAVFNFSFKKRAFGEEFTPYEIVRNAGGVKRGRQNVGEHSYSHPLQKSLKQRQTKISVEKKKIFKNIHTKSGPIMLTGDDISPENPELSTSLVHSSKKQQLTYPSSENDRASTTENKYCVCNDVEKGQMILCDNADCVIGWYHFECVRLCEEKPEGSWYCPICRGPAPDEINPSFARNKER